MSKQKNKKTNNEATPMKEPTSKKTVFDSLKTFWKNQMRPSRFPFVFIVLMILFYIFYYSNFYTDYINRAIIDSQAAIGSWLVNLFGHTTKSFGSAIAGQGFSIDVAGGCDGIEVTAMLIAAIVAFPALVKYKWKGILVGVTIIQILNVLRLPALYYAGLKGSMELFDFLHLQGGFTVFVSISILLFLLWINWMLKQERKAALVEEP